ncbi:MAG TPA: PEP-CTERM sorting domain-containing protein [Rhizomicrobium sp.]|nr:PEP-CTERM sorting domain-containing protein [Rhizomicrobium sp.]
MKTLLIAGALLVASAFGASATVISGNYSLSSTASPTFTYDLGQPFSFDLDVNVPQTVKLANIRENAAGSSTITASFVFDDATLTTNQITAADIFTRTGNSAHDDLTWANAGLLTVSFSNGAILEITLSGGTYNGNNNAYVSQNGLETYATFKLVQAPQPVIVPTPEPITLSLFGAGLAAIGGSRSLRRRKATQG